MRDLRFKNLPAPFTDAGDCEDAVVRAAATRPRPVRDACTSFEQLRRFTQPRVRVLLPLLMLVTACDCDGDTQVGGDFPYTRCALLEVDEARALPAQGIAEGHTLTFAAIDTAEVFALSPGSQDALARLAPLEEGQVQLVLGGFAQNEQIAEALLPLLAARGPALLLPGGEDSGEVMDALIEDHPQLVDLRGVRRLVLGQHGFLLIAGTEDGRYTMAESGCGFGEDDTELLLDAHQEGDHLISWTTPARLGADPLDIGIHGNHAGSLTLRDLVSELAISGSISAWPREGAGQRSGGDAIEVVAPLLGALSVSRHGGRVELPPVVLQVGGAVLAQD